jgi:hypothetical protein
MKRIFIFLALVCAAAGARADLVVQQQITTPTYNEVVVMKIKGTKIRTDMYAGQPQAISTIADLSTGESIMLLHNQKLYFKTPGQPMKQAKSPNTASPTPVPRPTGQNQKVGDYNTELYMWTNSRGIIGTIWVAQNYPDYARIRADYALLDKAAGADTGTTPELSTLPGMAVRSQVTGGGQTNTLALISAKEEPLDTSLFRIPRDYKEVPKLNPVKTAPLQPAPAKVSAVSTSKASAVSAPKAPVTSVPRRSSVPAKTTTIATNLPPW